MRQTSLILYNVYSYFFSNKDNKERRKFRCKLNFFFWPNFSPRSRSEISLQWYPSEACPLPNGALKKFCRKYPLFIDLTLSYEEHAVIVLILHFLMILIHNITIIGTPSNPTFCFWMNLQKFFCYVSSPKMSI